MLIKNLEEMKKLAERFIKSIDQPLENKATIVGLYGNLGSGKTAFVKKVAEVLGIKEHVISPTFVIFKNYKLNKSRFQKLVHITSNPQLNLNINGIACGKTRQRELYQSPIFNATSILPRS